MHIVRYLDHDDEQVRVGVRTDAWITPVNVPSLGALLALPLDDVRAAVDAPSADPVPLERVTLLPPADGRMEVWASGVTYERSRAARKEESTQASVYDLVYDAERPELFLKSVPWRLVTDGEPIAVRRDSRLDVPEPELAVVANAFGEIVGYTVCDDVSSRDLEGTNPLYLPQAKIYAGSCSLATGIRPAWHVRDAHDLAIDVEIRRGAQTVWSAETSTATMRRRLPELVEWLFAETHFPEGVVLSTGTGLVPEMTVTLIAGDVVTIRVAEVGTLSNPVVEGKDDMSWLLDTDPATREKVR
ncbi:fumarylacetoacetate hydrolase family protein [Nocardioides sp. NPDC051685]|uniref:fumarylacetoacetate hydrolase family protein n=1 Tax=Nocardioides sp. NPDC051685 TaxID=3364334 RepID=UPI0037B949A7